MSDAELRALERSLSGDPVSLDLLRRHAHLLQRSGDDDAALRALDLAWRLGAEDLWDELSELLETRAIKLGALELRYVPGGLFVMGIDDFDDDAAPPHLVSLSPFWISCDPLTYSALVGYAGPDQWLQSMAQSAVGEYASHWRQRQLTLDLERLGSVVDHLLRTHQPDGLVGSYALPSEAQWERATRAALLRPDGVNPYGLSPDQGPQWTRDHYHPRYYQSSPGFDPQGPGKGRDRVVRGITAVPPSHYAIYREAADESGTFRVGETTSTRAVRLEGGLGARVVFECK